MQSMWTCGTLGKRMPAKVVARSRGRWERKSILAEKRTSSKENWKEAYFCDWSPGNEQRFLCFFERHGSLVDKIRKRRQHRCSLLEIARKLRLERNRVCGEFETMLNSCPGKGIVNTGCAKMMIGSDTFRRYLKLLSSKERASIERAREKKRFRFGDNETRMSLWSAVIPMSVGGHVRRDKVVIVAGDAPFMISKPFLQRMGAVLDLEQGQVTFNKLGVTLNLEESATGHYVIDLISGCGELTSGKRSRNESGKDSEDAVDNSEFREKDCH